MTQLAPGAAWRIPYPYRLINQINGRHIQIWITPVCDWIKLINVGDAVELLDPETLAVLGTYGVSTITQTSFFSLSTFLMSLPDGQSFGNLKADVESAYNIVVTPYTIVAAFFLLPIESVDHAYESVIESIRYRLRKDAEYLVVMAEEQIAYR